MRYIYPRMQLEGTDLLRRTGVIYSQILNDLLMKVEDGSGSYPKGFFHTSTTPDTVSNYYDQMWSRDVGRGIMELCRAGLLEPAGNAVAFILAQGFNCGDHYGRLICSDFADSAYEVDGNVNILMAIYTYWFYSGQKKADAARYLQNADSVFGWFENMGEKCPHGFLLASRSELSGNPETPFLIYAIYATYGGIGALKAYARMAQTIGDIERAQRYDRLAARFTASILEKLVSEGAGTHQNTKTPQGVWINGLDEITGTAAEIGDFGPRFFIHRWTRQLPYVLDYDRGVERVDEPVQSVNEASYRYIRAGMVEGYYFRRYGFVSCTCFSGMGDRHDDTMAGYGQNLFTQAALLADDVNVYTKCLDGISRLAYDGDVVAPLTPDRNPWVMHECFTYENYEQGLDHTYGRTGDDTRWIMHNPGDEGNLVQASETLKTYAIVAGVGSEGNRLILKPRLPWECTRAQIENFPAVCADGSLVRISYDFRAERWKNTFTLTVRGASAFSELLVRIGPLPNLLCNEAELQQDWDILRQHEACFAQRVIPTKGRDEITVTLINER